ncbi:hypothetical protein RFN58_02520 [Streptomyces iakyrus]|uniref:hypothetical protein n=1 Tax=Streptomyces iakyrus TaxID=68219 RepID=UPI0005275E3E|nr:hypothetical protein [Streptomyces iakyrus]
MTLTIGPLRTEPGQKTRGTGDAGLDAKNKAMAHAVGYELVILGTRLGRVQEPRRSASAEWQPS